MGMLNDFVYDLHSSSRKSSFVFVIMPEEEQPKVSSIHKPGLRWSPQQPLQLYTAPMFHGPKCIPSHAVTSPEYIG